MAFTKQKAFGVRSWSSARMPCLVTLSANKIDLDMCISLQTVRAQGIGGLYKGFGPAVVRGFPANGEYSLIPAG